MADYIEKNIIIYAMASIILLISGWLFTLLIDGQIDTKKNMHALEKYHLTELSKLKERVSRLESIQK